MQPRTILRTESGKSQAQVTRTSSRPAIAGCLEADGAHSGHRTTHSQQPSALGYVAGTRTRPSLRTA